nr:CoA transferase [Veronia nyctiphanis]
MNNELPLAGVNVVDFGQYIAGPAVAMILADMGATVVHIDPPSGPLWKDPANATLNRNKLCLTLDLKSDTGRERALLLCAEADIIIENFRPGKLQSLGIDFASLRKNDPRLITLSIPGFASNDTLRREWKATESIIAATSGAFTDMGFNRVLMGLNPSFSPLSLGSAYATTLAASSVALAMFSREKTGLGDHIEVPVAAALMEGLSYNSVVVEGLPERYLTMREKEIIHRRSTNQPMDVSYDALQEYLDPFYRTYQCKDGRYFYVVCPSHRNHAKRCLRLMGIYDELLAEGLPDVDDLYLPIQEWNGETSIGVYPLPEKWAGVISEKMKREFVKRTSDEWGQLFGINGIPGAPHRTTKEWVNSEHCNDSGLVVGINDPEFGEMRVPGPLVWFEHQAEKTTEVRARQHVSYTDAIASFCLNNQQKNRPQSDVSIPAARDPNLGWLSGVRILDLTNVIAGPHSAAFLARFGAEVIKLDPTKPMYDPLIGVLFSIQSNIAKKAC